LLHRLSNLLSRCQGSDVSDALRALIFDVDGTLADAERDGHRVAFNAVFAEPGLDWCWDEATYSDLLQVAGGVERMVHYAREHRGLTQPEGELHTLLHPLHVSKTRHYVQRVATGAVQLRPGVARLIAQARAEGLQLAIATTTTRYRDRAAAGDLGRDSVGGFAIERAADGKYREHCARQDINVLERYHCAAARARLSRRSRSRSLAP
jgi:phosphoglycolate phosphatase-like HAD superfamily hydrolase